MPETTEPVDPTDFAEIALDVAMECTRSAAEPWAVSAGDLSWLKEEFRKDFENEVKDLDTFKYWVPQIRRLFRHVGTAAAFIAEAVRRDVSEPPGKVWKLHLIAACLLVKWFICPAETASGALRSDAASDPRKLKKLCNNVAFLQKAPPAASIQELLDRWLVAELK